LTSWGNPKEISQDLKQKCRPPQVWFILGSNFQMPESTTFICTNNSTKYKRHGTTQPSYRSGRRCVLSPGDGRTLVRKVQINPRTTAKDLVKMLEETSTKVSISTVKRNVRNCENLSSNVFGKDVCKLQTSVVHISTRSDGLHLTSAAS
jgi:hypothetical protein